jgi:hypothetical protein
MPDYTIIWAGDLHVFEMMPQQAVRVTSIGLAACRAAANIKLLSDTFLDHESDPTSLRIIQRGLYTGPELANKWVYRRIVRGQETARNHQTNARTRDPHRTHQHSRCCRLAAGTEREVYPRDHVVTIGLRNTLYGELAARD